MLLRHQPNPGIITNTEQTCWSGTGVSWATGHLRWEVHPGRATSSPALLHPREVASVAAVIVEISSKRLGATAVLNESGDLKGIITDGDLRRMLQKTLAIQELQAKDIMTVNPKSIGLDDYATAAFALMKAHNITQLVVVDGDKIAGFVHIHDLMKEGIV